MSRWVVRWLPVPASCRAPRARPDGRADRPATTRIWSPHGWTSSWSTSPSQARPPRTSSPIEQHSAPPQISALDGSEALVTVTIGGNDVGYVPLLMAAALPRAARRLPLLGARISELLDRDARDRALAEVFDSLCAVGKAVRERAPQARIFFVDYLTMLPPAGVSGSTAVASRCRPGPPCGGHPRSDSRPTRASATGCEVIRAAAASRQHHAWSAEPWTTMPAKYIVPLPRRPAPLHPNSTGMRAVAKLVAAQL